MLCVGELLVKMVMLFYVLPESYILYLYKKLYRKPKKVKLMLTLNFF